MDIKLDNEKLHGEVTMPPSMALLHLSLMAAALTGLHTGNTDAWDSLTGECATINEDVAVTIRGLQTIIDKASRTEPVDKVMAPITTMKGTLDSKNLNMGMLPKTTIKCGESDETLKLFMPVAAALGVDTSYMCGRVLYGSHIENMADQMEKHGTMMMKVPMVAQGANASGMICVTGQLRPGAYIVPSNVPIQFIAGMLFALTLLNGKSTMRILGNIRSASYLQLALRVLDQSGINIRTNSGYTEFEIDGGQQFKLQSATMEGDWGIGAYFVAAGAIGRIFDTRGQYAKPILYPSVKDGCFACGNINIHNLSLESIQLEKCIVELINEMSDDLGKSVDITIGNCQDILPILAIYACVRTGATTFNGTMRLNSIDSECSKYTFEMIRSLGGKIRIENDRFTIYGQGGLKGGTVKSHNDWRITMASAMAAGMCEETVIIENAESVNRNYNKFFEDYSSLQW